MHLTVDLRISHGGAPSPRRKQALVGWMIADLRFPLCYKIRGAKEDMAIPINASNP